MGLIPKLGKYTILNFSNKEETKLEEFAMKLKESFLNSQIRKFRWIILNDYPSCLIGDFLAFVKKEKIMDEKKARCGDNTAITIKKNELWLSYNL